MESTYNKMQRMRQECTRIQHLSVKRKQLQYTIKTYKYYCADQYKKLFNDMVNELLLLSATIRDMKHKMLHNE